MALQTYVINLDGGTERLESVRRMLSGYGIDFERVPAFDGRKLDLATVEDYDAERAERYMGRSLVGAEIGCYRSHLEAASRFLRSGADYGLVFEDDALLRCNPVKLLEEALPDLEAHDPDWLLINIGSNKSRISTPVSTYSVDGYKSDLVAAHYFPMMACAIVWSREGARQFVENHGRIFAPVDNYFRYWLTRAGHGYSFWPAPVTTTDVASQILSADGRQRKTHRRKWYYALAKQQRLLVDKVIALSRKRALARKLRNGQVAKPDAGKDRSAIRA